MQKKLNKGFTIIEVLIVLAIAGVIMLVVFLAVPALQRNSRNSQRTNDAALITAAINECLTNKNGQVTSCDTIGELKNTTLDPAKLRQLTTLPGDATAFPTGTLTAPTDTSTVVIGFSNKCASTGDASEVGSARQFVVMYKNESSGTGSVVRCLDS